MANAINSLKLGSGTYVFTTPYATCGTAAAEAAKVATTTPGSNFSLETGARVTVKFTVTNTAANPTLNVNSTGAKAIYYRGSAISAGYLAANRTYEFVYNGTQYELVGDINTDANTTTTTGASNTSNKIFLVGAETQSSYMVTYTHDTAYVGTDGCLYSNSQKVATIEGANEFTGSNSFTTNVAIKSSKGLTTQGSSALQYTEYNYGKITYVPDATNSSSNYTLTIPAKSGTIALTSDIPSGGGSGDVTAAGNNTFTGNNTFKGGTTSFITASFMTAAGRPGDPVTTVDSDGVYCSIDNSSIGTHYQDNQIQNKAFTLTLPTKNGTLATTSDIPIKTATLSGTTLSITLS